MNLDELLIKLDLYLAGNISNDDLESYTLGVIASDSFDKVDSKVAELIYLLDNKELENLSREDVKRIRDELERLLKRSNSR